MSHSRQLAAIMFTDIIGYTTMMQQNERMAVAAIKHYNNTLEKWVRHFNGRILNFYGDGNLCSFSSVTDAVNCSIEVQKELRLEPAVPLRIGLHIGEIFFEQEKALGDGVNVASRIQSLGQENTILISAEIHDKIKNNPSFTTLSLGQFDFKNVNKPLEIFALTNDGLIVPQRKKMEGKLQKKNVKKRNVLLVISFIILVIVISIIYRKYFSENKIVFTERSIAVIPFTDMSQKKDQEYFSDGLTEDIITQLAKINSFKVISRTSVMQYKKNSKTLKEIGNELGVDVILEGSVQQSGDQVRITAQLINTLTDEHLWAESYDRSIKDIFSIQTEIAKQIANTLRAKLSPNEKQNIEKKYTENTEAYQLYLQGRYYWNKRSEESVRRGIDFFKKAIALDSNYALAYAGLGDSYLMLGVHGIVRPNESFPLANQYAEKALALDNTLSESYATLIDINIHYYHDLNKAEINYHKAIELNPFYASAYHWHSEVLILRKQFENSLKESEAALKIDPYSLIINTQYAMHLRYAGKLSKAIDQLQKTLEYDSTFAFAHWQLGIVFFEMKEFDKSLRSLHKAADIQPDNTGILATLGYVEGVTGKIEEAKKIESRLLKMSQTKYVSEQNLALISLGVGKKDKALQYLEQAYIEKCPYMPFLGMNSLFSSLKDNPEFQSLLRKLEFPN